MSEDNKESRIKIEDLPQAEQELSPDQAKDVVGGAIKLENVQITSYQLGVLDNNASPADPNLKTK